MFITVVLYQSQCLIYIYFLFSISVKIVNDRLCVSLQHFTFQNSSLFLCLYYSSHSPYFIISVVLYQSKCIIYVYFTYIILVKMLIHILSPLYQTSQRASFISILLVLYWLKFNYVYLRLSLLCYTCQSSSFRFILLELYQ